MENPINSSEKLNESRCYPINGLCISKLPCSKLKKCNLMKTATIENINYRQVEETHEGQCHNCVCNQKSEESDALCRKLSKESGNDCEDAIWKEETK